MGGGISTNIKLKPNSDNVRTAENSASMHSYFNYLNDRFTHPNNRLTNISWNCSSVYAADDGDNNDMESLETKRIVIQRCLSDQLIAIEQAANVKDSFLLRQLIISIVDFAVESELTIDQNKMVIETLIHHMLNHESTSDVKCTCMKCFESLKVYCLLTLDDEENICQVVRTNLLGDDSQVNVDIYVCLCAYDLLRTFHRLL